MKILDEKAVIEMFRECIITEYYWKKLSKYELEKVYEYAMHFQNDSIKSYMEYWEKMRAELGYIDPSKPPPDDELYNMVKKLTDKLKPIVGANARKADLLHEQVESKKDHETPKTLSRLITHAQSNKIVHSIKEKYKNIKGKRLKLLLLAFQELDLLPKERVAKQFYDCCKNEFSWETGSYPAMNDYKFNEQTDCHELTSMKQYLETLIKTE